MSSRWDSSGPSGASPQPDASSSNTSAGGAAAAAAAAAAKIAAQFGTGQRSQQSPSGADGGAAKAAGTGQQQDKRREGNEAAFNEFVDVNDVKNRYLITRGSTQQQIHEETGASLTTKGRWYPDRNMAQPDEPPLYIHIEAATEEMLQKAVAKVNEVINSEAPQLIEERGMRGKAPTPGERPERPYPTERRKWTEERIDINLEPMRNFNTRAKIVGPGGTFVKYIQAETGTRVQIKGRGSGFRESDTGMESMEPLHVHITGPDDNMIREAKALSEDLIDAVKTEWEKSRAVLEQQGFAVPPPGGWPQAPGGPAAGAGPGGYGHAGAGADQGYGQHGYGQQQQQQQQQQGYHQQQSAAAASNYQHQQTQQQQYHQQQQQQRPAEAASAASAASTASAKDPHQEALDKYWKDYISWEDSYKAYHGKMPTKEEGGQDVPPQYRIR